MRLISPLLSKIPRPIIVTMSLSALCALQLNLGCNSVERKGQRGGRPVSGTSASNPQPSNVESLNTKIPEDISKKTEVRVGILHYMNNLVSTGTLICEPSDSSGQIGACYYVNEFSRILVSENDRSGYMTAGAVSERQGPFIEVRLDQLATSSNVESHSSSQSINFYLKLHWKGKRAGALDIELGDSHVIKGEMRRKGEDKLEIYIDSVPDLMFISMFIPSIDIAEVFGRNANSEADILKNEIKLWMKQIITPILKSYFNSELEIDKKP